MPGGGYGPGITCTWHISCEFKIAPVFTLTQLQTEIQFDAVQLFDGDSTEGEPLVRLSGALADQSQREFEADGTTMTIAFSTDDGNAAAGFAGTYSCLDHCLHPARVECGQHGLCKHGAGATAGVCVCSDGYTGSSCTVRPDPCEYPRHVTVCCPATDGGLAPAVPWAAGGDGSDLAVCLADDVAATVGAPTPSRSKECSPTIMVDNVGELRLECGKPEGGSGGGATAAMGLCRMLDRLEVTAAATLSLFRLLFEDLGAASDARGCVVWGGAIYLHEGSGAAATVSQCAFVGNAAHNVRRKPRGHHALLVLYAASGVLVCVDHLSASPLVLALPLRLALRLVGWRSHRRRGWHDTDRLRLPLRLGCEW
jgi:hypothetical protein